MKIYSIKLYLMPLPPDEQPVDGALPVPEFAFVVEYVGVDQGAVMRQADIVIAQWLKEGRAMDDILAVTGEGQSYRPYSPMGVIARGFVVKTEQGEGVDYVPAFNSAAFDWDSSPD